MSADAERRALWDDTFPRHDWSTTTLRERYDVVVVGAGIVGLTTALELAARGCSVAVLEARHVGAGASGRTTAKTSLLQGTRLSTILDQHGPELAGQYLEGNRAGQDLVRGWCARLGVAVQERPAITYAATREDMDAVTAELEAGERLGLPVRARAAGSEPFPLVGAVELDAQLQLDPRELLEALARQAADDGVTVRTGVRVTDVHGEDDAVVTSAGVVRAAHVVLATASPVSDRGGFFARLEPQRSYLTAYAEGGPFPQGMYLAVGSPTRSLRTVPTREGEVLLVGGNGHVVGRSDSEAHEARGLVEWTARHFPGAYATHRWSAQDFHTFDHLPHVGPLTPTAERVLVATGFAKWGMTNGPAAALVLAAHVAGEEAPPWADAFRSWSSHELAGAGEAVRTNAQVAATLVRDRLAIAGGAKDETPPLEGSGTVVRDGASAVATSTVDGVTCSVKAVCTHLGGIVRWNDLERSWDCPLHGSRFGPDGTVLEGPADEPLAAATSPYGDQTTAAETDADA